MTLAMISGVDMDSVETGGNLSGTGAIMALCDKRHLKHADYLAKRTTVINLAENPEFQKVFIERLRFEPCDTD